MTNTLTPASLGIPRESNLHYLPAFYLLPDGILKESRYCRDIPRNPKIAMDDDKCRKLISSKDFRNFVSNGIAQLAWWHIGIPDPMHVFTADDPLICWIRDTDPIIHRLKAHGYDLQALEDREYPIPDKKIVNTIMESVMKSYMEETNMKEVVAVIRQTRCDEDIALKNSKSYVDLLRQTCHSRNVKTIFSIDYYLELREHVTMEERLIAKDAASRFVNSLSENDACIVEMRLEDEPYAEIAKLTGYKNHSGVIKRMKQIGKLWQEYDAA